MGMSDTDRESLIARWVKPSSETEQDQQDRAERMVTKAIEASEDLKSAKYKIYTKGSYPNKTNVRQDSDVDVVVELQECQYYEYLPGVPAAVPKPSTYTGEWDERAWRAAVLKAMEDYFGASEVDSTGKIAIEIQAKPGSRPSADVVPSFSFIRYDSTDQSQYHVGSCVFTRDTLAKIVNWPRQQLDNGVAKNNLTNGRYKKFVRALKNAENVLAEAGKISDLPSYFMECMVYNVSSGNLGYGSSLGAGFGQTLAAMYGDLDDGTALDSWVEPNDLKWLFKGNKKWSVAEGKELILETWRYLDYGN